MSVFFCFFGRWGDISLIKPYCVRAVPLSMKLIHGNLASGCLPGSRHDQEKVNS